MIASAANRLKLEIWGSGAKAVARRQTTVVEVVVSMAPAARLYVHANLLYLSSSSGRMADSCFHRGGTKKRCVCEHGVCDWCVVLVCARELCYLPAIGEDEDVVGSDAEE